MSGGIEGCQRCRDVRGALGTGRKCRYSRGQKGYRCHKGVLGAPRGVGASRSH